MKNKYHKYIFWLYYVIFTLFILTSLFAILFPNLDNPEPTGLSSISPFFFIIFYFYPFICGLIGVILNFEKKYSKFAKIISIILNFLLFFTLTCGFYFVSILIFPNTISGIFQGQIPYQLGFLIGFNLVNILQFYIFEHLKNKKIEPLEFIF